MPIHSEATSYGYRSTFVDPVTLEQTHAWASEVALLVHGHEVFGQLIDVRGRGRLTGDHEQQQIIQDTMRLVKAAGMLRSCVVVADRQVALKIKQLAFGTPVYEWERYVDGADPDWERLALDWIERGVDPDLEDRAGNRPRRTA
jgi:hypothetical protein